ncbi:MAG: undecaprenyl-diphosphate phosphatase [Candidatus Nanoarchaeia archaeon]|jgi:undecaprenyl-diphosphatase
MNIVIAAIAGLLQGIFEWIPISSQGIISMFLVLTGQDFSSAVNIALFLHVGTMFAVISFFKDDIKGLVRPKNTKDLNLLYFILSSTFVSLLIGGPIYLFLNSESTIFSSVNVFIGIMLLVTGALQIIRKNFSLRKMGSETNLNDGLIVGASQGFSVIPGISRSGITVFALLLRGFNTDYALKLSFLMSVPVVFIESMYQAVFKGFGFDLNYLVAAFIAFFVGKLTIGFFLKFVKKIDFSAFCIILGFLSIVSAIF